MFLPEQPFYGNFSTLGFDTNTVISHVCLLFKMASKTVTRSIHKNNGNKTDTCLEGWGIGDTHFTGSHIGGIHISLGICVRGYTYRDTLDMCTGIHI